jgi:hypothetical protein
MTASACETAEQLRERFKAIPREARDANAAFSIRIWRGVSWLERAEAAGDQEGRFIPLWIAFNAIYGYLDDDGRDAGDHASWQHFLARVAQADDADRLGQILWSSQIDVARLVNEQFLFKPFWLGQANWQAKLERSRRQLMIHLQNRQTVGVLEELFERLYVLRQQVFHGAATSGSKLNRTNLKRATGLLSQLIPGMLEIMLDAGPEVDWGEVCFPPVEDRHVAR